jgi:TonB family protein
MICMRTAAAILTALLAAACAQPAPIPAVAAVTPFEGIPPQPDRKAIRQMLAEAKFRELDILLERYRLAFLAGSERGEERLVQAYLSFQVADNKVQEQIEAWLEHNPTYQAHTARAYCAYWMGVDARGSAWASKTRPEQFALMERYFDVAEDAAGRSLRLQPQSVVVHRLRVAMGKHQGRQVFARAVTEALAAFPASFYVRVHAIYGLQPRWGGPEDYSGIWQIAEEAQQYAPQNPRLRNLRGYPYWARAEDLRTEKRDADAIEMYTKALEYGEETDFLEGRSKTARRFYEDYALTLRDAKRVNELEPWRVGTDDNLLQDTLAGARQQARWHLSQDRHREAIDILGSILKTVPDDPEAYLLRGSTRCLGNKDSVQAGVPDLENAVRLDPENTDAFRALTGCLALNGQVTEGIRRQEAFVLKAPGNGKARQHLGTLYFEAKDIPSAILAFDIACLLENREACRQHEKVTEFVKKIPDKEKRPIPDAEPPLPAQERIESTKALETYLQGLADSSDYKGKPTKFIHRPPPQFPLWARDEAPQGSVTVMIYFNADGSAAGARVVESEPAGYFELAAITGVLRWRMEPGPTGWRGSQKLDFKMLPTKKKASK